MDLTKKSNSEPSESVIDRLNKEIDSLDEFFASYNSKLQRNDYAKQQCDSTSEGKRQRKRAAFEDKKARERQAKNKLVSNIDSILNNTTNAIDDEIKKVRGQLDKRIDDIVRDVESYRIGTFAKIDEEVKKEGSRILDETNLHRQKKSSDNSFEYEDNVVKYGRGCFGCGCGLFVVPAFLIVFLGLNQGTLMGGPQFVLGLIGALLAVFGPYFFVRAYNEYNNGWRDHKIEQLNSEFAAYTAQKSSEKASFVENTHIPYAARKEKEKEQLRAKFDAYKATKEREKEQYIAEYERDNKIHKVQSQCDDQINVFSSQYDQQIEAINSEQQKEMARLAQERKAILAFFTKHLPDEERRLSDICKEVGRTQPLLPELTQTQLNRTSNQPDFLALGQSHLASTVPELLWKKDVPYLWKFPFDKPLFGPYSVGSVTKDNTVSTDYLIRDLLMRLLFVMPVGRLQITAIDPLKMGKTLDIFSPLLDIKKLVPAKKWLTISEDITKSLREHYDYIEECTQRRFHGGINDWMDYNSVKSEQLPYKILCIFGFPEHFHEQSFIYLKSILEHGIQCGILPVITIDEGKIDMQRQPKAAGIRDWLQQRGESIDAKNFLPELGQLKITANRAEPFVSPERVQEYMKWIRTEYEAADSKEEQEKEQRKRAQATEDHNKQKTDIENESWDPQKLWSEPSTEEISTLIGRDDSGEVVMFKLNDNESHCLLAGQSGSGKSVLLHIIIQGLAHRYSPEEVNFYLMDYKDGVEFNRYAKLQIPHTRLVVASKAEAEYGITVLEHLQNELTKRNELFRQHDVVDYKGFRAKGQSMPRILLIIDEFQVLYQQSDAVTKKVNDLFGDILARGRSAGIHVLLSTQSAKVLVPVQGFAGVKERIRSRIALASSRDDSEYILGTPGCGNYAAVELMQANTNSIKYGILNTVGGNQEGNRKFLMAKYPDRAIGDTHQKLLAEKRAEMPTETSLEVKIFDGTRLPQLPTLNEFNAIHRDSKKVRMMLGEEFNFEAKPFVIDWEQKRRKNLCLAGADEAIRNGLLHSLLLSVDGQFERVIYFNTNPHFKELDVSIANLEIKRFDWDCGIADILADFKEKKTLFIVDPLDEAEEFHPPANFAPLKEGTPAHSFKQFLENAPLYGSYTVAFVDSWAQFRKQFKDSLQLFELRIGFLLNAADAADLTGNHQFKGLDSTKAVFANVQRDEQVLFRPFVVSGKE